MVSTKGRDDCNIPLSTFLRLLDLYDEPHYSEDRLTFSCVDGAQVRARAIAIEISAHGSGRDAGRRRTVTGGFGCA